MAYYNRSLKKNKKAGRSQFVATILNNIANIYNQQGKLDLALRNYKHSLAIFEQAGNPTNIAISLNSIGIICWERGELDNALEYFNRSLELNKQTKNATALAKSLNNIGIIFQQKGELSKAFGYFKRSLELNKQIDNPDEVAQSLSNIGNVYKEQGEFDKALECYNRTQKLFEQVGNPQHVAFSLNEIGTIYKTKGKLLKALDYFKRSLKLREEVGNPKYIAQSLNNIGAIYYSQGMLKAGLDYYKRSLKLNEQLGNPALLAISLSNVGLAYKKQGEFDKALRYYHRSLKLREKLGEPKSISESCLNLGAIYNQIDKEQASDYYIRAIKCINLIANHSGSGRQSFFKMHLNKYYKIIEHFIFEAKGEKAFELLQQCKAFGFLTELSELKLNLEQYVPKKLIQERKILIQKTSALYQMITEYSTKANVSPKVLHQKRQRLKFLEKKLEKVINSIRNGNPAYAQIQYPEAVTVEKIQSILKENELFLEYFCTSKESSLSGKTYCFVISNDFFEIFELGNTTKLNKLVKKLRILIWDSQEEEECESYYEQGINLFRFLMQPILEKVKRRGSLKKIEHLLIASDDILNLLSFEAICLPQESFSSYQNLLYLLDKYAISYTMSASVYYYLYQSELKLQNKKVNVTSEPFSFFGIGDPLFKKGKDKIVLSALPGTRQEIESIAALFSKKTQKILFGTDAIEPSLFLENLTKYRIIHFATHGLIDTRNPFYSALALTPLNEKQQKETEKALKEEGFDVKNYSDGFLRVRDIFALHQKINAELVVLSACETATGKLIRGDGIIGLTRAFQFADTPSLVVSLWAVSDESTSLLMQEFYKKMLKGNPTSLIGKRLLSLHFAKQKLRNSKEYAAPYYWAPFILRGLP